MCDLGSRVMQKVHPLKARTRSSTKKCDHAYEPSMHYQTSWAQCISVLKRKSRTRQSPKRNARYCWSKTMWQNRHMARQSRACHRKPVKHRIRNLHHHKERESMKAKNKIKRPIPNTPWAQDADHNSIWDQCRVATISINAHNHKCRDMACKCSTRQKINGSSAIATQPQHVLALHTKSWSLQDTDAA